MPSQKLDLLCQQIEAQNTDDFGKFYMYVSLLKSVAIRNTAFIDGLPKYERGAAFWRNNNLNIGPLPKDFSFEVAAYAREFVNVNPSASTFVYNLAMAYIRKGNITDLTYIIDKMLAHLHAINNNLSHNQEISNYINFMDKKTAILGFIEQVSACNKQLLSAVDNGCNAALSAAAVAVGTVLLLASVFSLVSSLLALGLMVGGAIGAYSYATQAYEQALGLEKSFKQIGVKLQALPQDTSIFGDKNHNRFFTAIVMPLPYAAITAGEQLVFEQGGLKTVSDWRKQLDDVSKIIMSK